MTVYGYLCVRRTSQSRADQSAALAVAGCDVVYEDTATGGQQRLPRLGSLIGKLASGDVVLVTQLQVFPGSFRRLFKIITQIEARGAAFQSLASDWPHADLQHGRPGVAQLDVALAEERRQIGQRLSLGRQRAKDSGVRLGRPEKMNDEQKRDATARRASGENLGEIARSYGVSRTLISNLGVELTNAPRVRRAPPERALR